MIAGEIGIRRKLFILFDCKEKIILYIWTRKDPLDRAGSLNEIGWFTTTFTVSTVQHTYSLVALKVWKELGKVIYLNSLRAFAGVSSDLIRLTKKSW